MIDFRFDKMALIGAVALIVIGPEKLPRVARTVGHLIGTAQRYVADVKAEVNRSIELEELKKMKRRKNQMCRQLKVVSDDVYLKEKIRALYRKIKKQQKRERDKFEEQRMRVLENLRMVDCRKM